MFPMPYGETVVIMRPVEVDDGYGGTQPGGYVDHHSYDGCGVEPAFEDADPELGQRGRQGEVIGFRLLMPYGADVHKDDRVRVRGRVLDVDGSPADWRQPMTGWEAGTVIRTRFVIG